MKKSMKSTLSAIKAVSLAGGMTFLSLQSFGASEAVSMAPTRAPAMDLSNAYAFPVPFKPSLGGRSITFVNLSTEATIRIFNLNGDLVRTVHEIDGDGIARWDVTDDSGVSLSSDVFFYTIENGEQVKSGKLLVVK